MLTVPKRITDILLLEEHPGDIHLIRQALSPLPVRLQVIDNGEEAARFLYHCTVGTQPCPDLILLDLDLPRRDGRDLLALLKHAPALMRIPVIAMSSQKSWQERSDAYRLQAQYFVYKPTSLKAFLHMLRRLLTDWITIERHLQQPAHATV